MFQKILRRLWYSDLPKKLVWKVILLQTLEEAFILTLLCKVSLWQFFSKTPTHQKYQNDVLCGNMIINMFSYILKFKLFFKNICSIMTAWLHVSPHLSPSVMTCLPKKVSLITIHRNKTHLINMAYFLK